MPRFRKRGRRSRRARPRRRFKRRVNRRRRRSGVVTFKYVHESSAIMSVSATGAQVQDFYGKTFQMDDLPTTQRNDLVKLFEEYRIGMVKVELLPRRTRIVTTAVLPTGGAAQAELLTATDPNDGAAPVHINELDGFQNLRRQYADRKCVWKIRPYIAMEVFAGVTPGYLPKRNPWLDVATTDIPHYGFKAILKTVGVTPIAEQTIDLRLTYFLQFRKKRILTP